MDMTWFQWPANVPRPTNDEWEAAKERHRIENEKDREQSKIDGHPYMGDCGHDLSFDMATCNIWTWWHYFFPEDNRYRKWI